MSRDQTVFMKQNSEMQEKNGSILRRKFQDRSKQKVMGKQDKYNNQ